MCNNYIIYSCIYCPIEKARDCASKGKETLRKLIEHMRRFDDYENIIFLELTEDALKNLPIRMVDNMECFTRDNIDNMVFNTNELKCTEDNVEIIRKFYDEHMKKLESHGFSCEIVILKEIKEEHENTGRTVGRKRYEKYYHSKY